MFSRGTICAILVEVNMKNISVVDVVFSVSIFSSGGHFVQWSKTNFQFLI